MQRNVNRTKYTALVSAGILLAVGSGCVDTVEPQPEPEPAATRTTITWLANPSEHRGKNGQRFGYSCPAGGTAATVWGTDIYTDDSSVCTAGVHAGKITLARGGSVTIEIQPGQGSYTASTRNGIASSSWGSWSGSFVFR